MPIIKSIKPTTIYMGKLGHGQDLLESMTQICQEKRIFLGRIEAIGAVKKVTLGYYRQNNQKYHFFTLDKNLEITSCLGNISIKDGQPMVHAHITLADEQGKVYGGHLGEGTTVFACEFIIHSFEGPLLEREFDKITGLYLWESAEYQPE